MKRLDKMAMCTGLLTAFIFNTYSLLVCWFWI